jgi:hypothetical protein
MATMPDIRRMRELRGAGLGFAAIAAVLRLDRDLEIDRDGVHRYVRNYGGDPLRCRGFGMDKLGSGQPQNLAVRHRKREAARA